MRLLEVLKKNGGKNILKQYWHSGAFFSSVAVLVLLGKSSKALEILRLSAQLKTKRKLVRRYLNKLKIFNASYENFSPQETSNRVWVCWLQGIDNAPSLVKRCFQSLKENLTSMEIILINSENMTDYVQIPKYIIEKWKSGQITQTHLTDLLRLELLIRYGGVWIDSTVLCTRKYNEIPDYYFNSDLFLYQVLKPGRDGHSQYISSWFISAKSNNKILMAVRYLCYEYWKENTQLIDYFLLHNFFSIVLEYYPDDWKKIVPIDNASPHILLLRLFDQFDQRIWEAVKEQTPFHKLSYKFEDSNTKTKGTYFDILLN